MLRGSWLSVFSKVDKPGTNKMSHLIPPSLPPDYYKCPMPQQFIRVLFSFLNPYTGWGKGRSTAVHMENNAMINK